MIGLYGLIMKHLDKCVSMTDSIIVSRHIYKQHNNRRKMGVPVANINTGINVQA